MCNAYVIKTHPVRVAVGYAPRPEGGSMGIYDKVAIGGVVVAETAGMAKSLFIAQERHDGTDIDYPDIASCRIAAKGIEDYDGYGVYTDCPDDPEEIAAHPIWGPVSRKFW